MGVEKRFANRMQLDTSLVLLTQDSSKTMHQIFYIYKSSVRDWRVKMFVTYKILITN
jgi:hypothetical protein